MRDGFMMLSVQSHLVAFIPATFCNLRVLPDFLAQDEKRCVDIVFAQYIQDVRRHFGIWTVIKR